MFWIFIIVIAAIWLVADQIKTDNQFNKMKNQMASTGGFLMVDYKRDDIICQDIRMDWGENKKRFPPEYVPYLSKNKNALSIYIRALANQQAIAEGHAPICVDTYNKFTYNPFSGFDSQYGDKIRIYNESGVYYS